MTKKQIMRAFDNGGLYDLISSEGYSMRKEDILDILKEYIFCVYEFEQGRVNALKNLRENLEERLADDDEE